MLSHVKCKSHSISYSSIKKGDSEDSVPAANYAFEVQIESDIGKAYRRIQKLLQDYKDERKGATVLAVQSQMSKDEFIVPTCLKFLHSSIA
jgi:hypothetical protein